MSETPTPTPSPTPTPTPTPAPTWYTGVKGADAEVIGHLQNRGLDKLTPAEAAVQAVLSHREAEKLIGLPANQLLRLPVDMNNADGMAPVWSRLGKPAKADEYDFATVKRGDKPLDDGTIAYLRATAFNANLSKDGAIRLAQEFVKHSTDGETAAGAERTAKITEARAALDKNWGPNKEANMFVAKQAAKALGVTEETLAALEDTIGYDKTMEMFRTIGSKIGEDKFVISPSNPGGVMTRDQAVAKKADLMKDEGWTKRYMSGGTAEAREMLALNTIITAAA